jgi:putative ABC transport system permease protein
VYVPYAFSSFLPITFVVRTKVDPTSLIASIRDVVTAIDPDVPVAELATLESWVDKAMAQSRFLLVLSATFAFLALVLASLGLYGVLSYTVRQRTREVGVRLALGASGDDMMRLMLGQGLVLSAIGLVLGLVGSFALTRVVRAYLVGVTPTDVVTFIAVPALLLVAAAVACYIPARRASRIEPSVALRED